MNWRKDPNHFEDARGFPDRTSSLDAIKSRQGVDLTQTGAINSAAKQAQQLAQQQSQVFPSDLPCVHCISPLDGSR